MKLHYWDFRHGFRFYYGEIAGKENLVPIPWTEGRILNLQKDKESGGTWWPLKDSKDSSYFSAKITEKEIHSPSLGSMSTSTYLCDLLSEVRAKANVKDESFRILEALVPCAYLVKDAVGENSYSRLRELIPDYPENPSQSQ